MKEYKSSLAYNQLLAEQIADLEQELMRILYSDVNIRSQLAEKGKEARKQQMDIGLHALRLKNDPPVEKDENILRLHTCPQPTSQSSENLQ